MGEYKIGRYIILTIMYSLAYNRLKLRIVAFCHLRMSLFTSAEGEAHLPESAMFKKMTLVLERGFFMC